MADGRGLKVEELGVPLGACASSWARARPHSSSSSSNVVEEAKEAAEEPLLDCEMVRRWQPAAAAAL